MMIEVADPKATVHAAALGIEASALVFEKQAAEPQLEPLPEPKIEPLSDAEYAVLKPSLLGHGRYLSKIPPRDFIDAALWLAAYKFEFTLLPVAGEWSAAAVRDKIARESRAGLWSVLSLAAEQSGKFTEERMRLLHRLVSYEKAALARAERLKAVRAKKIASEKPPPGRRGFEASS
jgi:hypothetical protein